MLAAAGGVLALGAAAGTRPTTRRVQIGRDTSRRATAEPAIDPDDVTVVAESGARFFSDGALVGLWRSLRAHHVAELDDDVATIEPDWDGAFIAPADSAAGWAEQQSAKGRWVLGPVLLAYDTWQKRYLWSCETDEPARNSSAFAVLLPPKSGARLRTLAGNPEDGG